MTKYQENNLDEDFNARTIEQILFNFISALDEVIATYKILEKIKDEDSRPNQLLFCHIINNFDSFISSLLNTVILSNSEKLKEYFEKNKNLDEKPTFKEIINIQEIGLIEWMKKETIMILEQDLTRKRHSQKLELLLDNTSIDYKKIYIYLTGPGKHSAGCFKKTPTPENKKTLNHKTTSEKLIGYADILYEKRNAITHNKNNYSKKVVERLNQSWDLKIDRNSVIVKRDTIKAVFRYYTSICLKLLESKIINNEIQSKKDLFKNYLEDLKEGKNVLTSPDSDSDLRYRSGGIEGRKEMLIESNPKDFDYIKYQKITGASLSTTNRDFKKFIGENFIVSKKRGVYNIRES